jgi:hypothetical protein
MMRRIGQAKAVPAADYAAQLARSAGKVVLFAKHVDVMDAAERTFEQRGVGYVSVRGNQTVARGQESIDAFTEDPEVAVAVCSLTAAGVGLNLQVASDVVLAELSWTDAEQTQAIDRVHRIGQDKPVTAWRIIAAQTIDARIAELLDEKAGLAARALDGSDDEVASSTDVQLEALWRCSPTRSRSRTRTRSSRPDGVRDRHDRALPADLVGGVRDRRGGRPLRARPARRRRHPPAGRPGRGRAHAARPRAHLPVRQGRGAVG